MGFPVATFGVLLLVLIEQYRTSLGGGYPDRFGGFKGCLAPCEIGLKNREKARFCSQATDILSDVSR
jgi:hypothetical protein